MPEDINFEFLSIFTFLSVLWERKINTSVPLITVLIIQSEILPASNIYRFIPMPSSPHCLLISRTGSAIPITWLNMECLESMVKYWFCGILANSITISFYVRKNSHYNWYDICPVGLRRPANISKFIFLTKWAVSERNRYEFVNGVTGSGPWRYAEVFCLPLRLSRTEDCVERQWL